MSFYVRRNYTVVIVLALAALAWGTHYLASKTQNEKQARADKIAANEAAEKRKNQLAREAKAKRKAEIEAQIAAREAAELAEKEAKAKAEAERIQRELELAAEIEAQRKAEEQAQADREFAWKQYVGTTYPELSVEGTTFTNVEVLSANAVGVTFSHSHGARKFKYEKLPLEIQQLCLYDADHTRKVIAEEKERNRKLRIQQKEAQKGKSAQLSSAKPAKRQTSSSTQSTASNEKKQDVRPRGSVNVRVIRQYRKYYSPHRKERHFKDLEVKVASNVSATLYLNGKSVGSIQAMSRQKFTLTSGPGGKYTIELRTTNGRVLDSEKHNRKSGL